MNKLKYVLSFLLGAVLCSQVYSQKLQQITGIYTNFEYIRESGDVVGMEVIIVYSTDGMKGQHYALVQEAEGLPAPPVLVQVKVNNDEIEFTIPEKQTTRTFKGKISKKELVGRFAGSDEAIHLKRKKSYWQ
ncbi:MAG: hypothetical protein WCT99_09935 [Bacteroidota bacterium]|jgi:hypothetical protein